MTLTKMKKGMHRVKQLLALALMPVVSWGAFQDGASGPAGLGMGGTSVAVSGSCWGTAVNPALLPVLNRPLLSVAYSPGKFGLSELASGGVLSIFPSPWGTFNGMVSHTGFDLYQEIVAGIAGGWSVAPGVHAGIALRYYHLGIEGYGTDQAIGVQLGVLISPHPRIDIGFSAGSINSPTIGEKKERIPQVYRTGISLTPIGDLKLAVDLKKDVLHPLEISAGVQYEVLPVLVLRAGTGIEPSQFSGGFGIEWGGVIFDYAFSQHLILGPTHQLGCGLEL